MSEEQKIINIEAAALLDQVRRMRNSGYRLAQIGCTALDTVEMNYSFEKGYDFINFRLTLSTPESEIPSISGIYRCGFLYENEIHDLFGIKIKDIAVDYRGNFYRTSVKVPFRPAKTGGSEV